MMWASGRIFNDFVPGYPVSLMAKKIRVRSGQIATRILRKSIPPTLPEPDSSGDHSPNPRILILSASVGAGHVRAAAAVETALKNLLPNATIMNLDVLTLTNAAFKKAYGPGYFRAAAVAPRLIGMLYDFLDAPADRGWSVRPRLAFERMNFPKLRKLLTHEHWDLVINTHFLSAGMIALLRRRNKVHYPQVTVVTDYDVHGLWVSRPCEKFFVANEESRQNLIGAGVDGERIIVSGIPIDPKFTQPHDRDAIRRRLGLQNDRPVVLQLAGGMGVGSISQIHEMICDMEMPLQILAVAGKNERARQKMETVELPARHTRTIFGFTTEMDQLMAAADVVISKPGGLTTSECLASGCAMVIVEPIPGQEDRNADFLLENGCGIKVNNLASLTQKLTTLLKDKPRLDRMRQSAAECARPMAAMQIATECVGILRTSAVPQL
jgi:processive 1,2-diacylglycerol beta-glucosyltransferase